MANMENKGPSRFDTGALGRQEGQSSIVEKSKEIGSQGVEKAKEFGSQATEKAKDIASSVKEQAGQVASRIGDRVSDTYEASRDYVKERGLSGMAEDVADVIRRNPLPALLVGLGVGFLIARALRED
jgi:hypothetical protein